MNIKEYIRKNRSLMIEDIKTFISIDTTLDENTIVKGKPFGEGVSRGLMWILKKAKDLGMEVRNIDGYAGEVTVGNGEFIIGILAHEDVVPAGEGWKTNPFEGVVKNGKIYGRGSIDDKGPLISSLYVMKYLNDNELIPEDVSIRLIIGTNEEESWKGIDYYKKNVKKLPNYSIVPDGYFPLVFCEKGLLDFDLLIPFENKKKTDIEVIDIIGGTGRTVVPGIAECCLACNVEKQKEIINLVSKIEGVSAEKFDTGVKIEAKGKSTHGMAPEKGVNAIGLLFSGLDKIENLSIRKSVVLFNEYIGCDYTGKKFNCDFEDELSGKLTLNVGVVRLMEQGLLFEINLRYPASMKKTDIVEALKSTCNLAGFEFNEKDFLPPVHINPNSEFVMCLMDAYYEATEDRENKAFSMGGATYARSIPNAVAFGPLFPHEEELAHEANENLDIKSLDKMTEIYATSIISMMELKDNKKI